jgi:hypothetical protein
MWKGEMKNKNFIRGNHAVAGVIEALLLVALVAIILSTIQLVYIPQVMSEREADHMDEVSNQFSFLKSIIDLQGMTKEDVPIASPITLGSRELPYFVTVKAFGELRIIKDVDLYNINVDYGALVIPLTSIKYTAYNSYYLDGADLIYVLEGGAIILKQPTGEAMRVEPAFTVTVDDETDDVNIYYDIPIITGLPGKNLTSGYTNCYVRTNYSSSDASQLSFTGISSMNISTDYPNAWYSLLNNSLGDNVNIAKGSKYVEITKKEPGDQINLYYTRIYIYAQISPGWVIP